jgi:ABC-type amino acid transport substrate-binding protein
MRISRWQAAVRALSLFLALGVVAFLAGGCEEADTEKDTITVRLINAGAGDQGEAFVFGVFPEGADPYTFANAVGVGAARISGAEAQSVAMQAAGWNPDNLSTWVPMTFTRGSRYFVGGMIDMNASRDVSIGDFIYEGTAFTFEGPVTVTLDRTNFDEVLVLPPP